MAFDQEVTKLKCNIVTRIPKEEINTIKFSVLKWHPVRAGEEAMIRGTISTTIGQQSDIFKMTEVVFKSVVLV